MKDFLKLGLHCRVDRGATVGRIVLVRRSGAALDLMLVSRPIQRDPVVIAGITIKKIEHRVADSRIWTSNRLCRKGFSCGEADDDALPAHGESRTMSERRWHWRTRPLSNWRAKWQRRAQLRHLFTARQIVRKRCRRTL